MAHRALDQEASLCGMCSDPLESPATIPCGHNYSRKCVELPSSCPKCERSLSPEPRCREDFLKHARDITLDIKTANEDLWLRDGNTKVEQASPDCDFDDDGNFYLVQRYCTGPDRFDIPQILSLEALTGRSYFEMEWSGEVVVIAAAYRHTGRKCWFGSNEISWALDCNSEGYSFVFNRVRSKILGPVKSRIGVYLDHSAGALTFYSVQGETMRLLHRVHTRFTQPLHAGVYVCDRSTAHFPKLT